MYVRLLPDFAGSDTVHVPGACRRWACATTGVVTGTRGGHPPHDPPVALATIPPCTDSRDADDGGRRRARATTRTPTGASIRPRSRFSPPHRRGRRLQTLARSFTCPLPTSTAPDQFTYQVCDDDGLCDSGDGLGHGQPRQ